MLSLAHFLLSIATVISLATEIASGQPGNYSFSLPLRIAGHVIETSDAVCPSSDVLEAARSEVSESVDRLLQSAESILNPDKFAYSCGGTEGWARIAYLDMGNSSHSCPGDLREVTYSGVRLCTRDSSTFDIGMPACTSALFPSNGTTYSQVCGTVIGYVYGNQVCLEGYTFRHPDNTIDDYYGDGVTLTRGTPGNREHIWTFFSSPAEDLLPVYGTYACPCSPRVDDRIVVPPWVGDNYFCDAGSINWPGYVFLDEPLWDGDGCFLEDNNCCSYNNPPYFATQLSAGTDDDIELRACGEGGANSGSYPYPSDICVRFVELFVK